MSLEEREREESSLPVGLNGLVGTICLQLKALVEAVQELSDAREQQAEDQATFYSVETCDPQEMQRLIKSNDMLLALNEIVNDQWQKDMRHGSKAEAMQLYRDHIFDVLQDHGIVLDDLL